MRGVFSMESRSFTEEEREDPFPGFNDDMGDKVVDEEEVGKEEEGFSSVSSRWWVVTDCEGEASWEEEEEDTLKYILCSLGY
jgi:hypothetical protein